MKITKTDGPPKDVLYFNEEYKDDELDLSPQDVEDVAEIFKTPLTGSYNWDYTVADNRIKKLYELGKELNWNGSIDLDWSYNHPKDEPKHTFVAMWRSGGYIAPTPIKLGYYSL